VNDTLGIIRRSLLQVVATLAGWPAETDATPGWAVTNCYLADAIDRHSMQSGSPSLSKLFAQPFEVGEHQISLASV
jgi:hypothetical protein